MSLSTAKEMDDGENVTLPHSWNALDATDVEAGYRRDASWYKKTLTVDGIIDNAIYQLYFEGVNIVSTVYVNGKEVGVHIGGYIGFRVDISDVVKSGENEILVRVDNGYDPEVIPSQKSDFFIFGGITRDVWLEVLPKHHVSDIKITTPNVSNSSTDLKAVVKVSDATSTSKVKATLNDTEGNSVVSEEFDISDNTSEVNFKNLKDIKLWDTDNPNLYTLNVQLVDGDNQIDEVFERVGFRWFEFKDFGAFYLNGKRLLLR